MVPIYHQPSMEFLHILMLACMPVLRVLLLCALGAFLASTPVNILCPDARKHLNKLVFYVFTPALVYSSLAQSLTLANLRAWWYLPLNILFTFIFGGSLGWLFLRIYKPEPHMGRLTVACCAAGNFGNLLLILVPALCMEPNNPFGDSDSCIINGVAYVSFGLWMAVILMWTFIFNILVPHSHQKSVDTNNTYQLEGTEPQTQNYELNDMEDLLLLEKTTIQGSDDAEGDASCQKCRKSASSHSSNIDSNSVQFLFSGLDSGLSWFIRRMSSFVGYVKRFSTALQLQNLLSPPTVAVALALLVGANPKLKKIFIGNNAPLRFFQESVNLLANAMLPSAMLIIGGNFAQGAGSTSMNKSILIGIIAIRLLILPSIGIVLTKAASHLGFLFPDRLFKFVLMMQFTMPTAMNIGTMCQLFGTCEIESATILFWSCLLSTVAIASWTMVYIWILF